jgi:hypothetical protein
MKPTLAIFALLASGAAFAGVVRDYPAGMLGTLRIELDDSWTDIRSRDAPIAITAKAPNRFLLLVTPVPVRELDDARLRDLVQGGAKGIAASSVEKTLTLREIRGAGSKGYYVKATDAAPKPGDYKVLYQGALAMGNAVVMFTVLHNPESSADAEAALGALGNAKLVPPPSAADASGDVVIGLRGAKDVLAFPGRDWLVDNRRTTPDGSATLLRVRSDERRIVLSVFVEREGDCHSATECLDRTMTNPLYRDAADIARLEAGPFHAAAFFLDKPAGTPVYQANVQASALVNGLWYDVHISKTAGSRPGMEPLMKVLRSLRIRSADSRP